MGYSLKIKDVRNADAIIALFAPESMGCGKFS
jgi:hypothetical protein